MSDIAVDLINVTKRFGGDILAVDDVTLRIEQGEYISIIGPSGCGKTTALRMVSGFDEPTAGQILIAGRDCTHLEPHQRNTAMVFQHFALFPHMTVVQNVEFGLRMRRVSAAERTSRALEMLRAVDIKNLADRSVQQLSGGQQQRVALARALAPCPVVILLDEPLSNLDADMRAQMRDEVLNILKKAHSTAILVTHDQAEAFSMADCVAVLNAGRTEQVGTPEEIYHFPSTRFVADFVGQADFIDGLVEKEGIETELGVFPNKAGLAEGSDVQLMIRPDDITFTVDDQGGAVVEGQEFRGSENIYTLSLASGKLVHSSRPSTLLVERGTRVSVTAAPAHIVAFSGDRVARPP
ncbi:MAG: ABC transporter ATP-binding protein [Dehalococcoidia bacterium]|nr:ABC transporter ATP-binding protein [Dehalococcoidia bacterium]